VTLAEFLDGLYRQRIDGKFVLTFRNGVPVKFEPIGSGRPIEHQQRVDQHERCATVGG